jgi:RNA polymerase sigma-70 factor, ECF subfamily
MALAQPAPRILRAARQGDPRAFQEIVESYRQPVLGYVRRLVHDQGLAEDLTQEIFFRVYQRLPGFSGRCLFTTWLFQVTKNRVVDELRAQQRRPRTEVPIDALSSLEAPDEGSQHDETVHAIWDAVAELELNLKLPLLLRDVAGLSYLEIADVLEIELSAVRWRIYRAREIVQDAVRSRGLGSAAKPERAAAYRPLAPAASVPA